MICVGCHPKLFCSLPFAQIAHGLRRDVEKRGDVLFLDLIHQSWIGTFHPAIPVLCTVPRQRDFMLSMLSEALAQAGNVYLCDIWIDWHQFINFVNWQYRKFARQQSFFRNRCCGIHWFITCNALSWLVDKTIGYFVSFFIEVKTTHGSFNEKIDFRQYFAFFNDNVVLVYMPKRKSTNSWRNTSSVNW